MIDVLHWFASFIVLSVALDRMESITPTIEGMRRWFVRSSGWVMVGLAAFSGVIEPFFPHGCLGDRIGFIGLAMLAVSHKMAGAGNHHREMRRVSDY